MIVTLCFEKNNQTYRIERGRSPNLLKFFINDQEQELVDESQGDSRRTQDFINDLLGMSHDMFKHIVALNTYTEPFLSMRQNDQRMIIEQLLGITILSEKAENLKLSVKETKEQIIEEDARIKAQQSSNEKIQVSIQTLKLKQSAWKTKRTADINKVLDSVDELEKLNIDQELEHHENLQKWEEHNQQIQSLQNEIYTLELAEKRANKELQKIDTEIIALDDAICYTCKQSLNKA